MMTGDAVEPPRRGACRSPSSLRPRRCPRLFRVARSRRCVMLLAPRAGCLAFCCRSCSPGGHGVETVEPRLVAVSPRPSAAPVLRSRRRRAGASRDCWRPDIRLAGPRAGALLRLAWLGAGLLRLRRLRAGVGDYVPPGRRKRPTLLDRAADVRYVRALRQPVTFGVFRPGGPPARVPLRLTPGVRRAVLVHELWHVRRRDWAWLVVEELLRAVFWFHPAIIWLISRVQSAREEVVDELTVLTTNARRTYLEALLAFADEPSVFPAAPFARRRHLFQRMLLISREAAMSSRRVAAACAAMAGVVALSGWYGVERFR